MLVDLVVIPLVVLAAHVKREVDVEEEVHLQKSQLLGRNAADPRIVAVCVEVVIERFGCHDHTIHETASAPPTSSAEYDAP